MPSHTIVTTFERREMVAGIEKGTVYQQHQEWRPFLTWANGNVEASLWWRGTLAKSYVERKIVRSNIFPNSNKRGNLHGVNYPFCRSLRSHLMSNRLEHNPLTVLACQCLPLWKHQYHNKVKIKFKLIYEKIMLTD